VLTGIAKREVPEAELFAIKTPLDIVNAKEFIKTHAKVNP
jgi:hypothetical protein